MFIPLPTVLNIIMIFTEHFNKLVASPLLIGIVELSVKYLTTFSHTYIIHYIFTKEGGTFHMDFCISCGTELSIMERNRAECWECRDTKTTEAYSEDDS
jgi:hypothetical protein